MQAGSDMPQGYMYFHGGVDKSDFLSYILLLSVVKHGYSTSYEYI